MKKQDLLEGKSVVLRVPRPEDRGDITENINDPEIFRWTLMIPDPYTPEHAGDFLDHVKKSREEGSGYVFGIVLKGTDEIVGMVSVEDIDRRNRTGKVGYWLSGKHRGRGMAREALQLLSEYAFDVQGLHRISACIFEGNERSERLLIACGFSREGLLRDRYVKDGEYRSCTLYSLLETDRIW